MQWICVSPSEKSPRGKMKILLLSLKTVSSQGEIRPEEETGLTKFEVGQGKSLRKGVQDQCPKKVRVNAIKKACQKIEEVQGQEDTFLGALSCRLNC